MVGSAGNQERADQEENEGGRTPGAASGPDGVSRAQAHPEAAQVRRERREQAVSPRSEKRPHRNGWGLSKAFFLFCFLADQE